MSSLLTATCYNPQQQPSSGASRLAWIDNLNQNLDYDDDDDNDDDDDDDDDDVNIFQDSSLIREGETKTFSLQFRFPGTERQEGRLKGREGRLGRVPNHWGNRGWQRWLSPAASPLTAV